MKLYYQKEIIDNLGVGYLFIDTCTLILLTTYLEEFSSVLRSLKDQGKELITIPSVEFEFLRTDNLLVYNSRAQFLKDYVTVYPIEKHLDKLSSALKLTIQKVAGTASYSDFLLYYCLYTFHHAHLLTENYKDFKTSLLDRESVFTIDTDKDIRHTGLYRFSPVKYEKIAATLLKEV